MQTSIQQTPVVQELRRLASVLGLRRAELAMDGEPGFGSQACSFDVAPEEFLLQAEKDFEGGGRGALLNSLTNSKRAIEAQVDKTLMNVGFDPGKLSRQSKVLLLRELGFVAPRIFKRINDSRNILEHEYRKPSQTEVEDALDLASLFIESGSRSVGSFSLGNKSQQRDFSQDFRFRNELSFSFTWPPHQFLVWAFKDTPEGEWVDRKPYKVGELRITSSEPFYKNLVRLGIESDRDVAERIRPAIELFCDALDWQ